jgi:hypothetical protein
MEDCRICTGNVMKSRVSMSGFDPHGVFGIMLPKPVSARIKQNDTRRFKNWRPLPFYQKGSLQMLYALFDDSSGASVVLSNRTVSRTNTGLLCHAGVAFQQDGSLDEVGVALTTLTDVPGEWWSAQPDGTVGNGYDVRTNGVTGGVWSSPPAADTIWIQISAERKWRVTVAAKSAPSTTNVSSTFEIRTTGGGSVLDSASISADANN